MSDKLEYEIDLPDTENAEDAPHDEVSFQTTDVWIKERFKGEEDTMTSLNYFQLETLIAGYERFKKMQQIANKEGDTKEANQIISSQKLDRVRDEWGDKEKIKFENPPKMEGN